MAFQKKTRSEVPGRVTAQAPRPSSVTIGAKGDAPQRAPGPTPAPTRTYKNPVLTERDAPSGYGMSKNLGPSSVEPGTTNTSPLADELKRVNAESDAGDHLQDVIERGTARDAMVDLQSLQTRPFTVDQDVPTAHGMKRQTAQSSKPGDVKVGTLPATLGTSAAPDPRTDEYGA
jgi:hypothetical protein